jgi:hypothetical protein
MASGGSLSFFADEQDARILLDRLNADPEIAFIVPDGPRMPPPNPDAGTAAHMAANRVGCNIGIRSLRLGFGRLLAAMADGAACGRPEGWRAHALAHFCGTAGQWPRTRTRAAAHSGSVARVELGAAYLPAKSHAGRNDPTLVTRYAAYTPQERTTLRSLVSYWLKGDLVVASGFQWTGGSLQTARWVASLEDWFSRNAVRLHDDGGSEVFWAFPSALQQLKSGLPYDSRSFDLDQSIRDAR